jgi:hypothetical protein
MKKADSTFEDFVNEEKNQETGLARKGSILERLANPPVDFLTGSQIIEDEEALKATQVLVEQKVAKYGCTIAWSGTVGQVMKDGAIVETTEIHGATWDRENRKAFAVRADLTRTACLRAEGGAP